MKRLVILSLLAVLSGCELRDDADSSPFDQEPCDYVLLIALDGEAVKDNDKLYDFVVNSVDRYFHDRMGGEDQVILSQLSGNNKPLLWQGTPQQLRRDFPNKETFRSFLNAHCDSGSRINEGIAESLDFALHTHSIARGQAKAAVMIVSDMIDDQPDSPASEARLMEALIRFAHRGHMAFYFVDQVRMADIRRKMEAAGFSFTTIESDIHGRPPLPRFE